MEIASIAFDPHSLWQTGTLGHFFARREQCPFERTTFQKGTTLRQISNHPLFLIICLVVSDITESELVWRRLHYIIQVTSKLSLHRYFVNKISFPSSLFCIVYMVSKTKSKHQRRFEVQTSIWLATTKILQTVFLTDPSHFQYCWGKQQIRDSFGEFHGSAALAGYQSFSFSVLEIWSHLVFRLFFSWCTSRLWDTQDTSVILWSSFVLFIPNQTQRKMALHITEVVILLFFI